MTFWDSPVQAAATLALALLAIASCLGAYRLVRGPSLPDRVVGLDLIATILVGALIMHGIRSAQPTALSVATVLALINFIATVGFATYVRRRAES